MGYQKALLEVRGHADQIAQFVGGKLDAAGHDLALRILLQQDIELWGPGVGAHRWPSMYHPVSMEWLHTGMSEDVVQALRAAGDHGWPEPADRGFDPSYLADAGVEPLDYDGAYEDDDLDDDEPGEGGGDALAGVDAVDEPDRWKRHVLTQGVRPVFRLPVVHSLTTSERAALAGLEKTALTNALEQVIVRRPSAAEAFVERAEAGLLRSTEALGGPDAASLREGRRWYECAVAVAEVPLSMPMPGGRVAGPVLPWSEENNRPLLRALYGLALVAHQQKRWNAAEQILMHLLYLDPQDHQQAGVLLGQARAAAGLLPPSPAEG